MRKAILIALVLLLAGCGGVGGDSKWSDSTHWAESNTPQGHVITGQVPTGAEAFVRDVYPQIQALLTKGPDYLTIRFEGHRSYYQGGVITIAVDCPNWKAALSHEIPHAVDQYVHHDQQEAWLAEVIACHTQRAMGYPVGVSVQYDPAALTGPLLTDYTCYVMFGTFLEREWPGAIGRVVESGLVGREAVSQACGVEWNEIMRRWMDARN